MSRQSMPPGVRRGIRLGAVEKADAPAATTVHVAGAITETAWPFGDMLYTQRCSRCGYVLVSCSSNAVMAGGAGTAEDLRRRIEARFFRTGLVIAFGPTANYLVSDRPLAADEKECEFVPAFAWE